MSENIGQEREIKNNNQAQIEVSALKVLAFFDLFDYPLTAMEIWQGMDQKCELQELEIVLAKEPEIIDSHNGFYFLPGRKEIVKKRTRQYNLYNKKLAIAIRAAKILRFIVGVKMLAACNNFSYSEESDIDVFVVVQKNRMWLTRAFVTLAIQLFGLRRHGKKVKNRICLSFYVTENGINLENFLLPDEDPYFIHWMNDLLPLYGEKEFEKFWQANEWLEKYLPNKQMPIMSPRFAVKDFWLSSFPKKLDQIGFNSLIGATLERIARKIQLTKMTRNEQSAAKAKDTRVVISDTVLKFHEQDRREEYRDKWKNKIKEIDKNE